MSKDTVLIGKLKECLHEAVVFLRTLGDFRIPAVVERRRKELLERLVDIQGDTLREKPPKFEDSPVDTPPVQKKAVLQKKVDQVVEKAESTSESSSSVTSPTKVLTKRDSTIVNSLVKDFEVIHTTAKKEEEKETPKRMFELRKTRKPQDFPKQKSPESESEPLAISVEKPATDTPPVVRRDKSKSSNELQPERPSSAASMESLNSENESASPKPKRGKKHGGIFKRKDQSKSSRKENIGPESVETEVIESTECDSMEVVEESVKISGKLEQKTKSAFKTKYVPKDVKLKDTTLHIGDKESVDMTMGCTVMTTDSGFELTSQQKTFTFKVDGGEEGRQKWVDILNEVINECSRKEDDEPTSPSVGSVPAITVEEPLPVVSEPTTGSLTAKNKKELNTKSLEPASDRVLPNLGVEMKGYIHRKKPGLGTRWEKTYCVLTYSAVYFTTIEDKGEYNYMLNVDTDGNATVSEKAKGHDKLSKTIVIKSGKRSEHLSIETKDGEFDRWNEAIKRVYCVGGVEELLSDDEEAGEVAVDEDLYDNMEDMPPIIPSSPRPSRPTLPPVPVTAPVEDDLTIDEDIYEDTDNLDLPPSVFQSSPSPVSSLPSLPGRNPPKTDSIPQPSLPPRNAISASVPQPSLPPRNPVSPPVPQPSLPSRNAPAKPTLPKAPAPIPTTSAQDDEIYDDIVAGEDETYDDVVAGVDQADELYDDVVIGAGQADEEMYDDVIIGGETTEEFYEDMVMSGSVEPSEDTEELYVDVDSEPPPPKVTAAQPVVPASKSSGFFSKSGTFSHVLPGRAKTSITHAAILSGSLSYQHPKKSKFEEKHVVVEDSNLLVYKTSSDKKHQEKVPLGDCGLELGSSVVGAEPFAFRVTKGSKVHQFSIKTKSELDEWVAILTKLVKYAPVLVDHGEQQVYQATQDHIAETDDEVTFKKGSFIRLISKETEYLWFGQLGNEAHVFDGKKGKFPADKVTLAEDLYI